MLFNRLCGALYLKRSHTEKLYKILNHLNNINLLINFSVKMEEMGPLLDVKVEKTRSKIWSHPDIRQIRPIQAQKRNLERFVGKQKSKKIIQSKLKLVQAKATTCRWRNLGEERAILNEIVTRNSFVCCQKKYTTVYQNM